MLSLNASIGRRRCVRDCRPYGDCARVVSRSGESGSCFPMSHDGYARERIERRLRSTGALEGLSNRRFAATSAVDHPAPPRTICCAQRPLPRLRRNERLGGPLCSYRVGTAFLETVVRDRFVQRGERVSRSLISPGAAGRNSARMERVRSGCWISVLRVVSS